MKRAGYSNLSALRLDKGADRHKTNISFPRRTAVKVNGVTASPPAMSTPKKHGETKADMQICTETAVSEQTSANFCCSCTFWTEANMQIPTGFSFCFTLKQNFHPPLQLHIPGRLSIDLHCVLTQPTVQNISCLFCYVFFQLRLMCGMSTRMSKSEA